MRVVLGLIFAFLPVQALALSCMPWTLEDSYARAAESRDAYVVVLGQIAFAERDLPPLDWDRQQVTPPETRVSGRIEGQALGPGGFATPFSGPLTLVVQCFGPWCAHLKDGARYLAFLRKVVDGYELHADPCTQMGWQDPTVAQIDRVLACHQQGSCAAPER